MANSGKTVHILEAHEHPGALVTPLRWPKNTRCYSLEIPSEAAELIRRLSALFPENAAQISKFVNEVEKTAAGLKKLAPPIKPAQLVKHFSEVFCAIQYLNSTLQDVFDKLIG